MPTRTSSTCICTGLRFTKNSVYGIGCPDGALILMLLRWKPQMQKLHFTNFFLARHSRKHYKYIAAASAES